MAYKTVTLRFHPNNNFTLPLTMTGSMAKYFVYYCPYYINSIISVDVVSVSYETGGDSNVRLYWYDVFTQNPSYSTNSSIAIGDDNVKTWLKNNFTTATQLLMVRWGIGVNGARKTFTSLTITMTIDTPVPEPISAGTLITATQMTNLKTYIDQVANGTNIGTSYTIIAPTQTNQIKDSDWNSYISKVNAFPFKTTTLSSPGVGVEASASQHYNAIINELSPTS